jgi:hypothetical protein
LPACSIQEQQANKKQTKQQDFYHALSSWPTARHLSVSAALFRRIVRLQHARLTLVCLRESVAALFAHALDLADLANGFLELLHSTE